MPDTFYDLAARLSGDKLLVVACVFFGLVGGPLLAFSLDHGKLYGVALMAAGWWPIVLLLLFHPDQRTNASRFGDWFNAMILDALAASVPIILLLAARQS